MIRKEPNVIRLTETSNAFKVYPTSIKTASSVYVIIREWHTYTLGKKGCYTPGWCVFFVIISISSVREV